MADAPDGLQHERTALAWNRTALAMIVAGALYLRAGGGGEFHPARHVPGALLMGLGAAVLVGLVGRHRRLATRAKGADVAVPAWVPRVIAAVTVLFSLASLVLIVFGA
ncbi:MAG TPA: DUF202 domain-containing protein [Euzebyales bacterium]|nr:DUF202 domain-containing protein [Euzebyales bacterium]